MERVVDRAGGEQLIAQITLGPIEPSPPATSESAQSNYFFNLFSDQSLLPTSTCKWFQRFYSKPIQVHSVSDCCLVSTLNGQLINLRSNHPQPTLELNKKHSNLSTSSISTSKPAKLLSAHSLYPIKTSAPSIYSNSSRSSSISSINSIGHHSIKASPTLSISILKNHSSSTNLNDQLQNLQHQPYSPKQKEAEHHNKQSLHSPQLAHESSRSHSRSPTFSRHHSPNPHHATRNSISHQFESLWQGSTHQHLRSASSSTINNHQSHLERPTSPPSQPPTLSHHHQSTQAFPYAFSSSTLNNTLPYSDPIISITTIHTHQNLPFTPDQSASRPLQNHIHIYNPRVPSSSVIFTLSRFGKCLKLSTLDGHIINSIDLSNTCSDGLVRFDDWIFLKTPPRGEEEEGQMMNSDIDNEDIQAQKDPLILCISSATEPILLNMIDFNIQPSTYISKPKTSEKLYKTSKIWSKKSNQNQWTIQLISISWTKELYIREIRVHRNLESHSWTIEELEEPILLKRFGNDLVDYDDDEQVEITVDQDQFAVWSGDRFWVFARKLVPSSNSNSKKEQDDSLSETYPSQIPHNDDWIVSLSLLGSFGILVVTKKHIKLFKSSGYQRTLQDDGWLEWKLRPVDEPLFRLSEDSDCEFEYAINQSIIPSFVDNRTDLIKSLKLLTVDLDFSTGQRSFSELTFSHGASENNVSVDESSQVNEAKTLTKDVSSIKPTFYPHRRDIYLSGPSNNRPNEPPSTCLTCSILLEDDHRPTILVGDSEGQISIYSLNILSQVTPDSSNDWKLELLVEKEESLAGPISALYADQQWILAGGVSGDLGVWARRKITSPKATSSQTSVDDRDTRIDQLRMVDRMLIGAVPIESFGGLSDVENIQTVEEPGGETSRLSRLVVVMMDGTAIVINLNLEGIIEVVDELSPPDTSLGIDELWSNGPEILIFYRERELGAQRWFPSQSLSAHLGRKEAKIMMETENGQPLTLKWNRIKLSNCSGYTTSNPNLSTTMTTTTTTGSTELSACRVVNVSGMTSFNLLSIEMRDFVDSIGLQDGDALAGRLSIVRLMVSKLLPWGLDLSMDEAAEKGLEIKRPSSSASDIVQVIDGDHNHKGLSLYRGNLIDSELSTKTYRLLSLAVLLRVFLNEARYERHASETIVGLARLASGNVYSTSGYHQQSNETTTPWLDLEILVKYWLDPSTEIREAARLLFGVRLGSMSNEEIEVLVAKWQGSLPIQEVIPAPTKVDKDWTFTRKTGSIIQGKDLTIDNDSLQMRSEELNQKEQAKQLDSLLLIGLIVSERYKVLSSKVLKDLSISVFQTISPTGEKSSSLDSNRIKKLRVGFEICSKTFEVIQNYIDAIELVRNLFGWATSKDGELADQDLKGIAKYTCLHVASVNTPLFMTTLSYDLSFSTNPSDRISTMKLVVFMVRKRPLVLHTSLPRLVEAVVKSLDPTQKQMRKQTQTGATVIIHELVRTYPSITFHGRTQKLAIGTPEGAILIYDLKTGTKMDILESFRTPVVAVSFSNDGQRLVSVSLDENRIEIWKFNNNGVAAFVSFGSLFNTFTPSPNPSAITSTSSSSPSNPSILARFSSSPSSHSESVTPPNSSMDHHHHHNQLRGSSKPFKSLSFNVGEEAMMSIAGTLEWVRFEWLGERSCRLRIRQSSITFSC
ncbi:hypothetical protein MJO28_009286 [Puccinia striiformis f. sp. tritici]|uniref:Uncharacterized protein n=1 Tax=Puccinia striiformis f. sp. tritici TaxID=168172 RepID=A0ACC0E752_9BASI|nr:hypothetical protein MJO28_009286 [Puccinia striiformis f. sp. tritici]